VKTDTYWAQHLEAMGNKPGANQGDVVVRFAAPLEDDVTLPSSDVTLALAAGNVVGVQAVLPDGRRVFWPAGSVLAIEDAPT
jgi:nucleoid-associated protein YgaU